jgi:hypothetical protein
MVSLNVSYTIPDIEAPKWAQDFTIPEIYLPKGAPPRTLREQRLQPVFYDEDMPSGSACYILYWLFERYENIAKFHPEFLRALAAFVPDCEKRRDVNRILERKRAKHGAAPYFEHLSNLPLVAGSPELDGLVVSLRDKATVEMKVLERIAKARDKSRWTNTEVADLIRHFSQVHQATSDIADARMVRVEDLLIRIWERLK